MNYKRVNQDQKDNMAGGQFNKWSGLIIDRGGRQRCFIFISAECFEILLVRSKYRRSTMSQAWRVAYRRHGYKEIFYGPSKKY